MQEPTAVLMTQRDGILIHFKTHLPHTRQWAVCLNKTYLQKLLAVSQLAA